MIQILTSIFKICPCFYTIYGSFRNTPLKKCHHLWFVSLSLFLYFNFVRRVYLLRSSLPYFWGVQKVLDRPRWAVSIVCPHEKDTIHLFELTCKHSDTFQILFLKKGSRLYRGNFSSIFTLDREILVMV